MMIAGGYFNGGDTHSFFDALGSLPAGDALAAVVGAAAGYAVAVKIDWLPAWVGVCLGMAAGVVFLGVIFS